MRGRLYVRWPSPPSQQDIIDVSMVLHQAGVPVSFSVPRVPSNTVQLYRVEDRLALAVRALQAYQAQHATLWRIDKPGLVTGLVVGGLAVALGMMGDSKGAE